MERVAHFNLCMSPHGTYAQYFDLFVAIDKCCEPLRAIDTLIYCYR